MADMVAVTGLVALEPHDTTTREGLRVVSFRLASSQRRFNRATNAWEYGPSNWFTVAAFRGLAGNVAASVHKGDRVVVTGRLRIRTWTKGEKTGIAVDIEADSIGHDLTWGTAAFTRSLFSAASRQGAQPESAPAGMPQGPSSLEPALSSGGGFDPDEDRHDDRGADGWAQRAAQ